MEEKKRKNKYELISDAGKMVKKYGGYVLSLGIGAVIPTLVKKFKG